MNTKPKKVTIRIWIDDEMVSLSEFDMIPALINSFARNVVKFLLRKLEE